jgi:hypothetical protein
MSQPSVRDRDVEAFACDINTAKFPRNDEPEVKKITFFQHDVTKPFPDEFLGTFDLINLSFLCYGLTRQGWKSALQNVYSLLSEFGDAVHTGGVSSFLMTQNAQSRVEIFSCESQTCSHTIARIPRHRISKSPML